MSRHELSMKVKSSLEFMCGGKREMWRGLSCDIQFACCKGSSRNSPAAPVPQKHTCLPIMPMQAIEGVAIAPRSVI